MRSQAPVLNWHERPIILNDEPYIYYNFYTNYKYVNQMNLSPQKHVSHPANDSPNIPNKNIIPNLDGGVKDSVKIHG